MIVKNESKIITRCLDSVRNYIDYWVICDTGSTDNTQKIIQDYFNTHNIRGELHQHEWKDFGLNRSQAVRLSKGKADYLLLMDADFVLVVENPTFKDLEFDKQVYFVKYTSNNAHEQFLFIKSHYDWYYQGRTHEHLVLDDGKKVTCADMKHFKIQHMGDGSNKSDKYRRDIDLLLLDLKDIPSNSRTIFYLAQSYFASGDWENAIKYYEMRIAIGGKFREELYICYLNLSHIFRLKSKEFNKNVVDRYVEAYNFRPSRLEALYYGVKYCYDNKEYNLGYITGAPGIYTPYPKDKIFVDRDIHTVKFKEIVNECAKRCDISVILDRMLKTPVSLCEYGKSIIANNLNKRHCDILILGNFRSFNLNRGIDNNRIKFFEYISRQNNSIIIQGLEEKYFLENKLSLKSLLDSLKSKPSTIIYYLMGTTDLNFGNPFYDFQDFQNIEKWVWIEDIQYVDMYTPFIRQFDHILLGQYNKAIFDNYKKRFNKVDFLDQYIDNKVFKDYGNDKVYDILFYGCTNQSLYPFRYRLYNICSTLKYKIKIINHPGYNNDKSANDEGNITGVELSKLINSALLTVCTKSKYDFLLKKYLEVGMSRSVILGDLPESLRTESNISIVKIDNSMTDKEIVSIIDNALSDKEKLLRLGANNTYFDKYNYDFGYHTFMRLLAKTYKNITIHSTNWVTLPPHLNMKRNILRNEIQERICYDHKLKKIIPREHVIRELEKEDLEQYDFDTIFYDIFYKNGYIYLIGPNMLNLEPSLKFIIYGNGKELKPEIQKSTLNVKIICKVDPAPDIHVKIDFYVIGYTYKCVLPGGMHHSESCITTITTLQKNNKLEWIIDWIKYYNNIGVKRFVIYDNGSDHLSGMVDGLDRAIDKYDVEIILVEWFFKYGPHRSTPNQFCQTAQLLHCCIKYCSGWMINADIDEFIVIDDIPNYLTNKNQLIYLDSYDVPKIDDTQSLTQLKYRFKEKRGYNHKYIVQTDKVKFLGPHDVILTSRYSQGLQPCGPHDVVTTSRGKVNFDEKLADPHDVIFSDPAQIENDKLFFFHYHGLTNNTKARRLVFDPDIFCVDNTVVNIYKKEYRNITIYTPEKIEIPIHYNIQSAQPLLYDIFLSRNNEELIILAPNPHDLDKYVLNILVYLDDIPLKVTRIERSNVRLKYILKIEGITNRQTYKCKVVYPSLKNLELNCKVYSNNNSKKYLALTTLQKDNKIEWISDWLYYYKHLGINSVILYDNNSNNREQLLEYLEHNAISRLLDITVVLWDYPYNNECQAGSLTHAMLKYNHEWMINVDIDEYIANPNLSEYLKNTNDNISLIKMDSYIVYNVVDSITDREYSVPDYKYRSKLLTGDNYKYIIRPKDCLSAQARDAKLTQGVSSMSTDLIYYHYIGISTNWKKDRGEKYAYDSNNTKYIRDLTIVNSILPVNKCTFLYWGSQPTNKKRPAYLDLCLETIQMKCDHVVIVTDQNVLTYLPDLNERWWDVKVPAHRSDYIRQALVYEYGGFWLDFDTILLKRMDKWFSLLDKYDYVDGGTCLFGARKGCIYLKEYISGLDELLKKSTTFQWTEFYDVVGHPLKSELTGKYSVYKIPEKERMPLIPIFWDKDNEQTGWISDKLRYEDYYNPDQISIMLHNAMYPQKFKALSRKELLKSNILMIKFISEIFFKYIDVF
jgi:hypothetical protein